MLPAGQPDKQVPGSSADLAATQPEIPAQPEPSNSEPVTTDAATFQHDLATNLILLPDVQDELARKINLAKPGQLTATVAHETRNPLGAIRTSIFLVRRRVEAQQAKIFEPLFSTNSFGIGLGVPAIKQIMEEQDGGLEYAGEPGRGTTATAWFPVKNSQTVAETDEQSIKDYATPDVRISA